MFSKCHYYAFVVLVTSPQKMKYWKIPERMSSCAKLRCRVNLRTFERFKGETIIILGWFFAFEITIELWIQKLNAKAFVSLPGWIMVLINSKLDSLSGFAALGTGPKVKFSFCLNIFWWFFGLNWSSKQRHSKTIDKPNVSLSSSNYNQDMYFDWMHYFH